MGTEDSVQQRKTDAEIAKLEAEAEAVREKAKWEAEKLKAETHELEKPFWYRPGFYAALLPAPAQVATIGWTVFSGSLKEFLSAQDTKAKAELRVIEAETKLLEYERAKFADEAEGLKKSIDESKARLAELEGQLKRAPLNTIIKALHEEIAVWETWPLSDFQRLSETIRDFPNPEEALAIVEEGMADVMALPVRAKLLYSYYRATGDDTHLRQILSLIPKAVEENLLESSFWSLAAQSFETDTDLPVEPRSWRVDMCNSTMHAFGAMTSVVDLAQHEALLDAFDNALSSCSNLEALEPKTLDASAVYAMSSGAASLYRADLQPFYTTQVAQYVAATNLFAGKLLAAKSWSEQGFRPNVTYIMSNVLDFGDPKGEDPETGSPTKSVWSDFLDANRHLLDQLLQTPFEDWPTGPAQ